MPASGASPSPYGNNTFLDHRPSAASPANVIACFSGLGSGIYAAWVGRDHAGHISRVTIDFTLLELLDQDAYQP